jgi:hypothetical protein
VAGYKINLQNHYLFYTPRWTNWEYMETEFHLEKIWDGD